MTNYLLEISAGTIDWSRAQFALTAIYHWLFVPLTLGLAVIMGIVETCYYRTGKQFWKDAAKFWQKLFGINFAIGVASGIILEFEFGTNWSNYSWFVGDIFGAPLAIEGIVAFFMESTFVAVMFFGWNKVSKGFHLASTWLTGLGATISAWWILVANAWMQYPVGCEFNADTVRNEMVSFFDVALSPFAVTKFCHTVMGVPLHKTLSLIFSHSVDQCGHQYFPRAAFGISSTLFLLSSKVAQHRTVFRHSQRSAERAEFFKHLRRIFAQRRHCVRVGKIHAPAHRIFKMFLRRVLLSHRIKRRIESALRHHRLRSFRRHRRDQPTSFSCFRQR